MPDKPEDGDLVLYFDGLCEPKNPGGTMCGAFLLHRPDGVMSGVVHRPPDPRNTNNLAEYRALYIGLIRVKNLGGCKQLIIRGDSQLVIRQLTGEYACNSEKLIPARASCLELLREICTSWEAQWIPREQNTDVDAICRAEYFKQTGHVAQDRSRK